MSDLLAFAPIILVLLAFSGFFSGSETALTAASRARMHAMDKDGVVAAGRVARLRDKPERLIGAILLGNNLVNNMAAVLAALVFTNAFGDVGAVYATVAMTALVLIFAEVLPKTYAISNADRMAMAVSLPILVVVRLFAPLVAAVQALVRGVLALFGVSTLENPLATTDELRGTIDLHHQEGAVKTSDRHMLGGILDLREMTVGDVMIHRKSMAVINVDQPAADVIAEALDSPFTRIPLWKDDPENIVGVLHAKDVSRAIGACKGDLDQVNIRAIAREPWFVPETGNLFDQLEKFRDKREHFALVIDEYGALMGLVTLEDILEEIVGQIDDEHDMPLEGVDKLETGGAEVIGTVSIRDLNRNMGWELPDDEAVTIAGLVIHEAQTIPEMGQKFSFFGHRFEVLERKRNQITRLRITPIAPEDAAP